MSVRERLVRLVEGYTEKHVDDLDYVSDATSTAIRATIDGESKDFLLCVRTDGRALLTPFELEEVIWPIWPPMRKR